MQYKIKSRTILFGIVFVAILSLSLLFSAQSVRAQGCYPSDFVGPLPPGAVRCAATGGGTGIPLQNPINATSVPELVNSIVKAILGMVGALALFMFVYGGMLWMTSAGNAQRIEKGKETLIWATIGLVIIFASYAILSFIFTALSGKS